MYISLEKTSLYQQVPSIESVFPVCLNQDEELMKSLVAKLAKLKDGLRVITLKKLPDGHEAHGFFRETDAGLQNH